MTVSIHYFEDFNVDEQLGFGTVLVEIPNEQGDVTTAIDLKWDESVAVGSDYIPSPYTDPYGFTQAVLEAAGVQAETSVVYGE